MVSCPKEDIREHKMSFIISIEQLERLIPGNDYVEDWCEQLQTLLPQYEIDTVARVAAFMSQCAHESGNFRFISENLNYRWESLRRVFGKYFTTDEMAKQYARQPERIANIVYANRMGNGPTESGDGWRYRGRGLIQITGKHNYEEMANSFGMSLEEMPEYLSSFEGATRSACWYWDVRQLNKFADAGDVRGLTRAINGGFNGLDDRIQKYRYALNVLNV